MERSHRPEVLIIAGSPDVQQCVDSLASQLEAQATLSPLSELEDLRSRAFELAVLFETSGKPDRLRDHTQRVRELWPSLPIALASRMPPPDPSLGWLPLKDDIAIDSLLLDRAVHEAMRERALRDQLAHYRSILENAPVGVFRIRDNKLIYVNEYLLQRIGVERGALDQVRIEDLFAPEDRVRGMEQMKSASQAADASPRIYNFVTGTGEVFVGEVRSWLVGLGSDQYLEGTIRNITQETRILQLHRVVLELTEIILAEQDIDQILQSVLDTITEYSGFRRAVLSLYDLSIPVPFEGAIHKLYASGLTVEDRARLFAQEAMGLEERRMAFCEEFRLGPAYYIPYDRIPWDKSLGLAGTTTVEGWNEDDFLFLPLRGAGGIIGSISVDDPVDRTAPTVASIEPVAFLANVAAFAVERVFKLNQLRQRTHHLHGLAALGAQLASIADERMLFDTAAEQVVATMEYGACGIWMLDGVRFVHEAIATSKETPSSGMPPRGDRVKAEGPGITRWVLHHGKSAIVSDTDADDRYDGPRESVRSFLATPISGRKGVIGVLYAASSHVAAFGEQDQQILATVASQLSTALNAVRRRAVLSRIYAFGQRLAVATTSEQAISRTLDFLLEQFDFQLTSILMLDADDKLCVVGAQGAYRESGIHVGWEARKDSGVIGWVFNQRRSAVIPDVSKDDRYFNAFRDTRSELAVPLLFNERLMGVINVESPQLGFFDEEDRQLIEVVATHLATALSNIESQEGLREQAIRDPLTGLFNRHYFNTIIAAELSRGDRYDRPMSLMMLDIDGFRAVNNKLGHLVGDDVLCKVADMLQSSVRESDRVIRYGGDEFLIFMPETNGSGHAELIAKRLKTQIAEVVTDTPAVGLSIGLSIGLYTRSPRDEHTLEYILEEVDRRMYADKRAQHKERADDYLG